MIILTMDMPLSLQTTANTAILMLFTSNFNPNCLHFPSRRMTNKAKDRVEFSYQAYWYDSQTISREQQG